jgi:hypothetical protein
LAGFWGTQKRLEMSVGYLKEMRTAENTAPKKIPLLKQVPVTSCNVKRTFLAYKPILSDKNQSITTENQLLYQKIVNKGCLQN